jgi:hypothetical protein
MGRKSVVPGFKMIDSGNLSGNIVSSIVSVKNLDKASIHLDWSGSSPVGTITVSARNGETDSWYTLDFGSAISISGNSGDHQIVLNELPFTDIRLDYTATSGTGTLDASITAKVLGA